MTKPFNPSSEARVCAVIESIGRLDILAKTEKGHYLYVMGGQSKNNFDSTEQKSLYNTELLWCGTVLPKVARALANVIPSHAGLIRISAGSQLSKLFAKYCESSMVGFYCFNQALETRFAQAVQVNQALEEINAIAEEDPEYIIYIADCNNSSSETGYFDFLSIGPDNPPSMSRALDVIG